MRVQDVRELIICGDYKKALRGAKDFRIGVTKEQRSVMARAYECYIRPEFYQSLGKAPSACIQEGIRILQEVV
jgi:hypothetical protein